MAGAGAGVEQGIGAPEGPGPPKGHVGPPKGVRAPFWGGNQIGKGAKHFLS